MRILITLVIFTITTSFVNAQSEINPSATPILKFKSVSSMAISKGKEGEFTDAAPWKKADYSITIDLKENKLYFNAPNSLELKIVKVIDQYIDAKGDKWTVFACLDEKGLVIHVRLVYTDAKIDPMSNETYTGAIYLDFKDFTSLNRVKPI